MPTMLPVLIFFSSFLEKRLVAHCFFLPLPTLGSCRLLCFLYQWHLLAEIKGPADFLVVGGAKSLVQGVGGVPQTVYPLCPSGVSDTGFRDLRVTACMQGWKK